MDIKFQAALGILALTLAGCGDDEPTTQQPPSDATDGSSLDTTAPDTSSPDTTEPDATNPDATEPDATEPACTSERAEAQAAIAIGAQSTALDESLVEVEVVDDPTPYISASIDAALGGAEAAQTSPWLYLDLETGEQLFLTDDEALQSDAWDLAFKRTTIRLNSGDSGDGQWLVTRLDDTAWDEAEVPGRDSDAEWLSDDLVDDTTCEIATEPYAGLTTAFGQWYEYVQPPGGGQGSVEAPERVVFALYNMQTHETKRLQIEDYDQASASYAVRWGGFPVVCDPEATAAEALDAHEDASAQGLVSSEAIDGGFRFTIDAALGGLAESKDSSWIYVDLETGTQLALSDVAAFDDTSWDLAFKRTSIRLNSGDSGSGSLMVGRLEDITWETVEPPGRDSGVEFLTDDFVDDETCAIDASPFGGLTTAFGQWYDYIQPPGGGRGEIHAPEDTVFVTYNFQTHGLRRLEIEAYDEASASYTLRWASFADGSE